MPGLAVVFINLFNTCWLLGNIYKRSVKFEFRSGPTPDSGSAALKHL